MDLEILEQLLTGALSFQDLQALLPDISEYFAGVRSSMTVTHLVLGICGGRGDNSLTPPSNQGKIVQLLLRH